MSQKGGFRRSRWFTNNQVAELEGVHTVLSVLSGFARGCLNVSKTTVLMFFNSFDETDTYPVL